MGLEIFFEFKRVVFVLNGNVADEAPRNKLGCVGGFSSVMIGETLLQISSCARVSLFGIRLAADYVDIIHREHVHPKLNQPVFVFASLNYAGQASLFDLRTASPGVARRAKPGAPGGT